MFTSNELEEFPDEVLNKYHELFNQELNRRKTNTRIEEIRSLVDEKGIYISTENLDFDDEEYRVFRKSFIYTALSSIRKMEDAEEYFWFAELTEPKDPLFDNTLDVFAPTKDEYNFYKNHVPTGKDLTEWYDKHKYGSAEEKKYLSDVCTICADWDEESCEDSSKEYNFSALYNIELFLYYKVPDDDEGVIYNVDDDKYEYYKLTDEQLEIYKEIKNCDDDDTITAGNPPRHFVFDYTETDGSYLENRIAV